MSIEDKIALSKTSVQFITEGNFLKRYHQSLSMIEQLLGLNLKARYIKKIDQIIISGRFPTSATTKLYSNASPNLKGDELIGDYNLNSLKSSSLRIFFTIAYFFMQLSGILQIFARSFFRFSSCHLFCWIHLGLFVAIFLPFSSHALTSQTTRNAIQGSAPYLTFDGGRTRVVDANGLLGITLSDGTKYMPSTNLSYMTPISLPVAGQSFADISMFVPTNTNSVDLSTLIGPPNNYWGDDDGDSDVTATGSLSLSIVDKSGQTVSRSTVPEICKAPYRVMLSSTNGILSTRYGVPNRSTFNESSVTYYVNPKAAPVVCFARPNLRYAKRGDDSYHPSWDFAGPSSMWDPAKGFLTLKTDPSLYGQNFPTTGANGLYFDLDISGVSQPLYWSSVSQGGITVTMSNSTATSVRVTLTGPFATESQHDSDNPGRISKPTLPQTFELVGRDSQGNPVVKYGFTLKQWFVHRGFWRGNYSPALSWCNSLGYRMPSVKDLTNASCPQGFEDYSDCRGSVGATPPSPSNHYQRRIGSGFFTEWGRMYDYSGVGFNYELYWTNDPNFRGQFVVGTPNGYVNWDSSSYGNSFHNELCAYP